MLKISNYQIFFELREKYPQYCELISEILRYSFSHKDSFDETTYLKGFFNENDVKFIFEKLNLHLSVLNVIPANLRSTSYTIVKLSMNKKLVC